MGAPTIAPAWPNDYVGLPWREKGATRDGCSCWGLCVLVYRDLLGICLPSYADQFASAAERAEIADIVAGATCATPWRSVPLSEARVFDVIVLRRGGLDCHVGLMVDATRMLHILDGQLSAIASVADGRWAARVSGVYRHEELA